MRFLPFLPLSALGCALAAQVPDGYVLVTHSHLVGSVNSGALTAIEPRTGVQTEIRLAIGKLNPLQKGVIVHPGDGTQLFGNPGLSTVTGVTVQRHAVEGSYIQASTTSVITGPPPGIGRYFIVGPDLYVTNGSTAANAGVWRVGIGQTVALKVVPMMSANAMTALGTKLYVADYVASQPSTIMELDTVSMVTRTVGSGYAPLQALTTFNGALLAGNDNGDLVSINIATGAATVFSSSGQGVILAAVADGTVGLPVFATKNKQVWRFPNYNTPLYTSTGVISEFSAGRNPQAAALTFGASCVGAVIQPAVFAHVGYPVIPSPAFQAKLTSLKPTAGGALLLGGSRTRMGALPLPFDLTLINMAGCWLYQDLILNFPFLSDASGVATVPLPIPNQPTLQGAHVILQGFIVDPTNNPFGTSTEGYELILW